MTGARRAEGEVSEREELLDGRLQLVLDGETADGLAVSFSLVWLLGREGATPRMISRVLKMRSKRANIASSVR